MIVEITGRHTTGGSASPFGSWLWFTALRVNGECVPLPAWYCSPKGEPKVIGVGWFPYRHL